jgi:hypothetical protein
MDNRDDALIGASGFVGSAIRRSRFFGELYDSKTIRQSAGRAFNLVVCAAAPGSMVVANRAPERDEAVIDDIIGHLSRLSAKRFILISTIATLRTFGFGQDEGSQDFECDTPYGRNRRKLEAFCVAHFDDHLVLRLPALFGPGLRKNMLFDLMNPTPSMLTDTRRSDLAEAIPSAVWTVLDRLYRRDEISGLWVLDRAALDTSPDRQQIDQTIQDAGFESLRFTNPASTFQFFDLDTIWTVADRTTKAGVRLLHVAPEPLQANEVALFLRGRAMRNSDARVHQEDLRTQHADLFGRSDGYIAGADNVMARLRLFVDAAA